MAVGALVLSVLLLCQLDVLGLRQDGLWHIPCHASVLWTLSHVLDVCILHYADGLGFHGAERGPEKVVVLRVFQGGHAGGPAADDWRAISIPRDDWHVYFPRDLGPQPTAAVLWHGSGSYRSACDVGGVPHRREELDGHARQDPEQWDGRKVSAIPGIDRRDVFLARERLR